MIINLFDGLRNLVANLGTGRDKSAASEYAFSALSRDQVISAYRSSWLPKKIVRIPAQDATRAWRQWSAEDDQVKEIEKAEKDLQLKIKVERAIRLARLLGGSVIYMGLRDRNPSLPVDIEKLDKGCIEYLTVLSCDWVAATELDSDPGSPYFNSARSYNLSFPNGNMVQNVHPSRMAIFHADEQPEWEIGSALTWGDPILQAIYDSVRKNDSTTAAVASLVFEAKIDVFKIPDLMKNAEDQRYQRKMQERMAIAALSKSINGALVMDGKEEYEQKNYSFAALADIMDRFAQDVSGAADIPMTRLFGRAPAGMNSTGESDMRNYYDNINSIQTNRITPAMSVLDDVLVIHALGEKPDDVDYEWKSLWQTSQKEDAEVASSVVNTLSTLSKMRALPDDTMQAIVVSSTQELKAIPGVKSAVEQFGLEVEDPFMSHELVNAALETAMAGGDTQDPGQAVGKRGQRATAPAKGGQRPQPPARGQQVAKDAAPRPLYVRRDVLNAEEIYRWAKSQGIKDLEPAVELHVTVIYSKTAVDWFAMGESWEEKIEIVGGPRLVEAFPGGPIVLLITASSLRWRNREMRELGASFDYEEYQPHITLSKNSDQDLSNVLSYQGPIILGPEIFEEAKNG